MVEGLVPVIRPGRTQDPCLLALFAHGSLSSFGFYFVFCFVGVLYGWVFFFVCFCFWWLERGAGWGGCLSSFNILVEELAALEPEPRSVGPQSHELTL